MFKFPCECQKAARLGSLASKTEDFGGLYMSFLQDLVDYYGKRAPKDGPSSMAMTNRIRFRTEVPIPYMFGLYFSPKFQGISLEHMPLDSTVPPF